MAIILSDALSCFLRTGWSWCHIVLLILRMSIRLCGHMYGNTNTEMILYVESQSSKYHLLVMLFLHQQPTSFLLLLSFPLVTASLWPHSSVSMALISQLTHYLLIINLRFWSHLYSVCDVTLFSSSEITDFKVSKRKHGNFIATNWNWKLFWGMTALQLPSSYTQGISMV